jgi:excisionase family DNA binding protein
VYNFRIEFQYRTSEAIVTDLIDADEAAEILGFSPQWVTALLRQKLLSGQQIGRKWILDRADVEDYKAKVGRRIAKRRRATGREDI